MLEEIGRALWTLVRDPIFLIFAAVAVICGITLKKSGKDLPKGMRIALIAAFILFCVLTLLLAVMVVLGAMTLYSA